MFLEKITKAVQYGSIIKIPAVYDTTSIGADFLGSLSDSEMTILNDLAAGYNMKEISARTSISQSRIHAIRQSLENKAAAYL